MKITDKRQYMHIQVSKTLTGKRTLKQCLSTARNI